MGQAVCMYIYVLKSLFPNFYLFNSKEKLSDNVIDWSFFLDKSYTKMVLNFWEIIFLKVNFKKLIIINVVLFNFRWLIIFINRHDRNNITNYLIMYLNIRYVLVQHIIHIRKDSESIYRGPPLYCTPLYRHPRLSPRNCQEWISPHVNSPVIMPPPHIAIRHWFWETFSPII